MELLLWRRLLLHYIVSLKGTANGAKRDQERSVSRYPQQNLKMPNRMGWLRWLPGLIALREYQASWLMHDIAAGGVLATMLVPVGIAYAVASGVPGIYGLYATIVPLVAYAVFGPSRILVLGPDSALVPLIASSVLPLAGGQPGRTVSLAAALAALTGAVCLAGSIARLGMVSEFVSAPVRHGYVNGIAVTVIVSQLP